MSNEMCRNVERYCFIDSQREHSKIIPGHKYNINLKHIKPRSRITTFIPIKKERFEKIKKDNSPGPCSYDSPGAIRKTQWSPTKGKVAYKNFKTLNYMEIHERIKKNVPGVGHYKNLENAMDK